MANLICMLEGVRGRAMSLYDAKCIIYTKKTAGSFITDNFKQTRIQCSCGKVFAGNFCPGCGKKAEPEETI